MPQSLSLRASGPEGPTASPEKNSGRRILRGFRSRRGDGVAHRRRSVARDRGGVQRLAGSLRCRHTTAVRVLREVVRAPTRVKGTDRVGILHQDFALGAEFRNHLPTGNEKPCSCSCHDVPLFLFLY